MNNHRLLILLLLVTYIFSPTIYAWVINPSGSWYRPFIIWAVLVVAAYFFQGRNENNDL